MKKAEDIVGKIQKYVGESKISRVLADYPGMKTHYFPEGQSHLKLEVQAK